MVIDIWFQKGFNVVLVLIAEVYMKRNQPSKFGFKINAKINDKINEIHATCFANKSMIGRCLVNFGLNTLFEDNEVKDIDWDLFGKKCFIEKSLNKTTNTANFQITKMQEADLLLLPAVSGVGAALVIRYVLSIGIDEYDRKVEEIMKKATENKAPPLGVESDIKDLIVLNCWG